MVRKATLIVFTTKERGIGMGPSIANKIVTAHHGRIWAENHPAGGAIFHVVLPALRTKNGEAEEKSVVTSNTCYQASSVRLIHRNRPRAQFMSDLDKFSDRLAPHLFHHLRPMCFD